MSTPIPKRIKVIVYNKTRKFAGNTIILEVSPQDTIKTIKAKICKATGIPTGIQYITFGVQQLEDESTLQECNIWEGYTVYSTPTYVEIPDEPSL